ncbi:hypothetical protein ACRB90_004283 [Escherichia coli]
MEHQKEFLTVDCDTATTAIIKVSSNGEKIVDGSPAGSYTTDKESAYYVVRIDSISATGGNASPNGIVVTSDANVDNVNIRDLFSTAFKSVNKAYFPMHGSFFCCK